MRSVCVFCGAHVGNDPAYAAAAEALGHALVEEGWRLVYGAGDVGMMGTIARTVERAGGQSLGIVPAHLLGREAARSDPSAHVVTETMHERKKIMFMNSDAIVVLPGGAGSLDEFFEALTWRQLGLHAKPVVLLDTAGYWQPLMALIDHVIVRGFADARLRGYITLCASVAELRTSLRKALS